MCEQTDAHYQRHDDDDDPPTRVEISIKKRPVVGGAGNIFLYDSSKQKENKNEKHKNYKTRHKLCVWSIVLDFLCSLVFGHRRSFFVFPSFVHVIGFQVERLKFFYFFSAADFFWGILKKKKKKKIEKKN